uniref:Uncharacterized protein n=1 Tax=Anguilla anguilla TaxID=7936 RepID=A0A0E9R3B9_ANGAN
MKKKHFAEKCVFEHSVFFPL